MAKNIQNVTLSLTLPISCQICLGKVRQPVICGNNHVFCSTCIGLWLHKASQCPTCRIPITPENPCREIIGATNESECDDSASVKKKLRKTRLELLLREYEDEIEALRKENEDLSTKNQCMELRLQSALEPALPSANSLREDRGTDAGLLMEWRHKLEAATDVYEKVKVDLGKLKEANKTLRSQNVDLVQENLRLRAEVDNRSPQKFGRYTVAALEAKISQYQRDVVQLKGALERNDKYIEELEAQVSKSERVAVKKPPPEGDLSDTDRHGEEGGASHAPCLLDGKAERQRGGGNEVTNASVCTKPDGKVSDSVFLLTTSAEQSAKCRAVHSESVTPEKRFALVPPHSPLSTPSTSFRSLSLKSPGVKQTERKPLSYLRRLSFDGCCSHAPPSACEGSDAPHQPRCSRPVLKSSKPVFWGARHAKWKSPGQMEDLSGEDGEEGSSHTTAWADAAHLDNVSGMDPTLCQSENVGDDIYSVNSAQSPDAPGNALTPEMILDQPASSTLSHRGSGSREETKTSHPMKRKDLQGSKMTSPAKISKFV